MLPPPRRPLRRDPRRIAEAYRFVRLTEQPVDAGAVADDAGRMTGRRGSIDEAAPDDRPFHTGDHPGGFAFRPSRSFHPVEARDPMPPQMKAIGPIGRVARQLKGGTRAR